MIVDLALAFDASQSLYSSAALSFGASLKQLSDGSSRERNDKTLFHDWMSLQGEKTFYLHEL